MQIFISIFYKILRIVAMLDSGWYVVGILGLYVVITRSFSTI